jgi:hypothetical protein
MIREGMKRGIERRGQMKPYRLTRPVNLQLTLHPKQSWRYRHETSDMPRAEEV